MVQKLVQAQGHLGTFRNVDFSGWIRHRWQNVLQVFQVQTPGLGKGKISIEGNQILGILSSGQDFGASKPVLGSCPGAEPSCRSIKCVPGFGAKQRTLFKKFDISIFPKSMKIVIMWNTRISDILSILSPKLDSTRIAQGFPSDSAVKNLPANAGGARDVRSIPGSGRSPGEGKGNPLQYSCLENPTARGVWRASVSGVAEESDAT